MKPGRNDPCPCGSGKKYKKCCLRKEVAATPERHVWRQVQDGMQEAVQLLSRDFRRAYGDTALEEAWSAFNLYPDEDELEPFDLQLPAADAFTNWLFFTWAPERLETTVADENLHGVVPAQTFLERHGHRLTPIVREYVQSCVGAPWSFYQVEQVEAGGNITLRDSVTGLQHEVYDPGASKILRQGDDAYGFLATVAGLRLIGTLQPVSFMGQEMEALDVLRERMASHIADASPEALAAELSDRDDEVRELYLLLTGMLPSPIILGSGPADPDEFTFHDLAFDIDSPQQAWDALKHLQSANQDALLLERDSAGHVRRASLLWCDPDAVSDAPEEQVLGSIDIEGNMLTVHTSGQHAWQAKELVEDALGDHARLAGEDTQDIDSVLASMADDPDLMDALDEEDDIDDICDELQRDYTAWMDMPLSRLDDRTPRECVKTPEGRQQVDALLELAQEHAQPWPAEYRETLFGNIRQQLGLLD